MKLTFEGVWADLRYRLKPRTTIPNWSILKGDTGGEFRIDHVDGGSITVIPEGRKPRSISKADFERIYRMWPAYKTGSISRTELTPMSQNSTYILSLFHWLETSAPPSSAIRMAANSSGLARRPAGSDPSRD